MNAKSRRSQSARRHRAGSSVIGGSDQVALPTGGRVQHLLRVLDQHRVLARPVGQQYLHGLAGISACRSAASRRHLGCASTLPLRCLPPPLGPHAVRVGQQQRVGLVIVARRPALLDGPGDHVILVRVPVAQEVGPRGGGAGEADRHVARFQATSCWATRRGRSANSRCRVRLFVRWHGALGDDRLGWWTVNRSAIASHAAAALAGSVTLAGQAERAAGRTAMLHRRPAEITREVQRKDHAGAPRRSRRCPWPSGRGASLARLGCQPAGRRRPCCPRSTPATRPARLRCRRGMGSLPPASPPARRDSRPRALPNRRAWRGHQARLGRRVIEQAELRAQRAVEIAQITAEVR